MTETKEIALMKLAERLVEGLMDKDFILSVCERLNEGSQLPAQAAADHQQIAETYRQLQAQHQGRMSFYLAEYMARLLWTKDVLRGALIEAAREGAELAFKEVEKG